MLLANKVGSGQVAMPVAVAVAVMMHEWMCVCVVSVGMTIQLFDWSERFYSVVWKNKMFLCKLFLGCLDNGFSFFFFFPENRKSGIYCVSLFPSVDKCFGKMDLVCWWAAVAAAAVYLASQRGVLRGWISTSKLCLLLSLVVVVARYKCQCQSCCSCQFYQLHL